MLQAANKRSECVVRPFDPRSYAYKACYGRKAEGKAVVDMVVVVGMVVVVDMVVVVVVVVVVGIVVVVVGVVMPEEKEQARQILCP